MMNVLVVETGKKFWDEHGRFGYTARVGALGMIAMKQRQAVTALALRIGRLAGTKTGVEKDGNLWFIHVHEQP